MPKEWSTPTEIDRDLMPSNEAYADLYLDITKRLEKTNGTKALAYPFTSLEAAMTARRAMMARFGRRIGPGHVITSTAEAPDGTPTLYVHCGPNYK